MPRFYKNRSRMLKHRAIRRGAAGLARLKGRRKSGVSSAVKKYVKKAIHTNVENKTQTVNYAGAFGNALANPSLYSYPMTPYTGYMTVGQGILQNQRIGNEIKIRKAYLRYVLRPMGYDVGSNPFPAPTQVDMYLGRTRVCPGDQPIAADFNALFQNGSSSIAPVGSLNDLISNVNTDYFTIKKRWSHKIGYSSANGTGGIANSQYFANNDFKMNIVKKLDITKYYPKILKFNDATNQVQGPGLFLWYQCVNAGGGINASTALPCHITFWLDIQYEDA